MKWIVAIGSVDLGYAFIGPFDDKQVAQQWIEQQSDRLATVAWPLQLRSPERSTIVIKAVSERFDG